MTCQGLVTINAMRHTENYYVLCNKETKIYVHIYIYINKQRLLYIMCSCIEAFTVCFIQLVVALNYLQFCVRYCCR
jgi:hypothetical protein